MSINTTPLSVMSTQLTLLKEQNKEINQADIQNKEQSLELICSLFFEMGVAITTLKMESSHLKSSNETLKEEIELLKITNVKNLNSFLNNEQTKIDLVATQIKSIVGKFDLYQANPDFTLNYNISAPDVKLLKNLELALSEINYQALNIYPEYNPVEQKMVVLENTTDFLVTSANSLIQTHSGLKNLITKSLQEYETLKSDFALIENTFQSLLTKKKQIIHFDSEHLKTINKKLQLKTVYLLVKNTFSKIQWDKLLTVTIFNRYANDDYLYEDQLYFSNEEQITLKKIADKKVKKVKGQMELIITNLEAIPGMIPKGRFKV